MTSASPAQSHLTPSDLYGLLAEFDREESLIAAAHRIHAAGYRRVDAYTPFPVHGLAEAIGTRPTFVPLIVLIGGLLGGLTGFFMQWYTAVVDYPINVGGRPYNSWPAFIPITFELTILGASLTAVFGMLLLNRLPQPYHPVFNVKRFARASRDGFFLCVESADPRFDLAATRRELESADALIVHEVPR